MFGPISIMGDLVPGNSLIGRTNGAVPYHDLKKGSETYEWYSDGELVGTSKVYTVETTDLLKTLVFKYHFSTDEGYHTIESDPKVVDLGYWRNLYWKYLGREPDKEGLEWWENRIEQYFKDSIK